MWISGSKGDLKVRHRGVEKIEYIVNFVVEEDFDWGWKSCGS